MSTGIKNSPATNVTVAITAVQKKVTNRYPRLNGPRFLRTARAVDSYSTAPPAAGFAVLDEKRANYKPLTFSTPPRISNSTTVARLNPFCALAFESHRLRRTVETKCSPPHFSSLGTRINWDNVNH